MVRSRNGGRAVVVAAVLTLAAGCGASKDDTAARSTAAPT